MNLMLSLEVWQNTLEYKGFRLNMTTTQYMECSKFSKSRNKDKGVVRLDGQEKPKNVSF